MNLSETMTALMDKVREITGITEKINVAQLTSLTQSYTFTIPKDEHNYNLCMYGSAAREDVNNDVTFYDCKLELGDLATPLTKVGGIVKTLLSALERNFNPVIGGVA